MRHSINPASVAARARQAGAALLAAAMGLAVRGQVPRPAEAAPATPVSANPTPSCVYDNHFERPPGLEWSRQDLDETPVGHRRFLGPFGRERVLLSLRELPTHQYLSLKLTLFVIGPAVGSNSGLGPDVWDLTVEEGPTLLHTTFDNCGFFTDNNEQAFPDEFPEFPGRPWPGYTGADERQTLGYVYAFGSADRTFRVDSVYHMTLAFPHAADAVKLRFSSLRGEPRYGDRWGIQSCRVEALPAAPLSVTPRDLARLWEDLTSSDPVRALHSTWDFAAAGTPGREFLAGKLAVDGLDVKRFKELERLLNDERPRVREDATRDLIALGRPAVPALNKALWEDPHPESRSRIQQIIEAIESSMPLDPDAIRRKRAIHALRILNGEPSHFSAAENGQAVGHQ